LICPLVLALWGEHQVMSRFWYQQKNAGCLLNWQASSVFLFGALGAISDWRVGCAAQVMDAK